jgi:prepilin-type N-terminal cleavage/methylation domain-containing protein
MYHKAATCLCAKTPVQPPAQNRTAVLRGSNFPASPKGFTIIELLVVIAIISLLVSILLPSLRKAKELAYEVACTSNLHQIGTAWHLYLIDNNDTFPLWTGRMAYFYGGKHPAILDKESGERESRPLNPYVDMRLQNESGVGLFRCPVDRAIVCSGQPSATEGYDTYDYYGNSYRMNWYLLCDWNRETYTPIWNKPFHFQDVEISNSQVILAGDCQWYFSIRDSWWDANFHNYDDRVGMLFLDGHAGFIQLLRGENITEDYSDWMFKVVEEEEEE